MTKSTKKKWNNIRLDTCFNPYNLSSHANKRQGLRKVTAKLLRDWNLPVTEETLQQRVCNTCRIRQTVKKADATQSCEKQNDVPPPQENPPAVPMSSDESIDENPVNTDTSEYSGKKEERFSKVIAEVNRGLSFIAISPIKVKKVHQKKYRTEKLRNISDAIKKNIFYCDISSKDSDEDDDNDDGQDVLNALQKRFNNTIDRTVQVQILTVVHQWSYRKILKHFPSATRHMINVAKQTATQKDILSGPNPKSHPGLDENVTNLVIVFYNSDEYSRVMPGQKDFVSVKVDGKRNHM
ncbi:PREDICTED: uncharacterized protein LOC108758237 isoform X2 [Trachymyrmex cornetzi]|uniref:uncharacterized protein LOC108758237 isoform X2 n=1 Tax=Trachymyrmex cornetzi TaxID=471704 RepID=UPI00084EDA59|nr:PREDICTED: uncharacterized protein LOC108758237 isoform X2 [Trachymyrmex cornetzi]